MKTSHLILAGLVAAISSMGAQAQQPAPAADSPPTTVDCAKGTVTPHSHPVDKGLVPATKKPCTPASAAAAPASAASGTKKIQGHNHSTFHK
jgi:hypothetical protein